MLSHGKHRTAVKVAQVFLVLFAALIAGITQTGTAQTASKARRKATRPAAQPAPPSASVEGWALKFTEEFDGTSLNFLTWAPHAPGKIQMGGIQTWIPEAITVSDGQAHITARATKTDHTSGIITTFGTFAQTYGRFEIRFRMPSTQGVEPLFRLLPVPLAATPSIDVLDAMGSTPEVALFANRWSDSRTERDYTGSYKVGDLSRGFHTAVVEWDADQIVWIIDGMERFHSFDGVPHQAMFLAVCLEISGAIDNPGLPAVLDVDYIRVFARP
jgi:beta-glucanase (GH16 family)